MAVDKTQTYIVRQNSVTNAVNFWKNDDTRTEEKVIQTAKLFEKYVFSEEVQEKKPTSYKKPFRPKLDLNTPQYSDAIQELKNGKTIEDIENKYWLSDYVKRELLKL